MDQRSEKTTRRNLPTMRQLQFLVAIAQTGSFSAACDQVFVTQPSLSAAIKELEDLLGVQLFERSRQGATLTAAGEEASARAARLLADAEELMQSVRGAGEPLTGSFRLGAIPTIAPFLLPQVLPAIRADWPELKLYLREDLTSRLLDGLRMRRMDAALIALPYAAPGIDTMPLFDDEMLFIGPQNHRLAKSAKLMPEQLRREKVLLLEDGHCLRDHALSVCHMTSAGAGRETDISATSLHTLVQMVASGLGVSLLPRLAVATGLAAGAEVVVREFDVKLVGRSIGMAWRQGSARAREAAMLGDVIAKAYRRFLGQQAIGREGSSPAAAQNGSETPSARPRTQKRQPPIGAS